jgi:hypothetical protein
MRYVYAFRSNLAIQFSTRNAMFMKDIDSRTKVDMLALLAYVQRGILCDNSLVPGCENTNVFVY